MAIRIMEECGNRVSCRNVFKKLQILPLTSQCMLSLLMFVCGSKQKSFPEKQWKSYAYWTVHHCDIWIKVDQLDDTCFIMSIYCSTCFGC